MAIWSRLTGAIAAIGIGGAGSAAVNPVLEVPKQEAWKAEPNRILDLGALAQLVAQGLIDLEALVDHAERNGYQADKLRARIQLELLAPPYAEVLDLWRRNPTRPPDEQISEEQVNHALAKSQIEAQYWPALKELVNARLTSQELALGIVRSVLADPGLQIGANDTEGGVVPAYPVSDIDVLAEAASSGYDRERLRVMVGEIGLPMALHEAANAYFRKIIDLPDFYKAVAQGDTRPAWGPFILEQARQIVTAHDGVEGRLRGWLTDAEMYEQTARHGMSEADTDLLLKITGRPIPEHQVVTGEARGGTYDGSTADIPLPFLKSLQESNIRPEWYSLAYANRYTYPSAFFFRLLGQTGALKPDELEQAFLEIGWAPKWAKLIADALTAAKGGAAKEATAADLLTLWDGEKLTREQALADLEALGYPADEAARKLDVLEARRVSAAKTSAIGDLHTAYKKGSIANSAVVTALEALGVSAPAAAEIVAAWQTFLTAEGSSPPA